MNICPPYSLIVIEPLGKLHSTCAIKMDALCTQYLKFIRQGFNWSDSLLIKQREALLYLPMVHQSFVNWAIPGMFSLLSSFQQLHYYAIFCQWLYSNHGPLESETTALPTEPQPRLNKGLSVDINLCESTTYPVQSTFLNQSRMQWPISTARHTSPIKNT